jgi:putative restriction endonuclease|tara:strand:+ start:735 stop:1643 length:909 start_codon:yes stop_codon:yes gene_type:complete
MKVSNNKDSRYTFGEIQDTYIGQLFKNRRGLHEAGIHRPLQSGIWGKGSDGACSIVISGGYVDDVDDLDEILYTGDSGRDPKSGTQISDQELSPGNSGLIKSYLEHLPVRVSRGFQTHLGPVSGYRYDGIYYVTGYEYTTGNDGFMVYQFNLSATASYNIIKSAIIATVEPELKFPDRKERVVNQLNRDRRVPKRIKDLYDHTCQVCLIPLKGKRNGYISAGAHIEPLGYPNKGPDNESNMLCLCPNHHSLFDDYGFTINADLSINIEHDLHGNPAKILNVHPEHNIDIQYLERHKNRANNY